MGYISKNIIIFMLFLFINKNLLSQEINVDLELVLAVDVSSSVDEKEYQLQVRGIAAAFRHPDVVSAIQASGENGIAVAMVQWSDNEEQALVGGWHVIRDSADAAEYARIIRRSPRIIPGGQTSIAGALSFAIDEIENNNINSSRRVIDVSGDGRSNNGIHPMSIRDNAIDNNITINGLVILNEEPFLGGYFERSVIGGHGAFMMVAEDYRDYAAMILQKLLREIGLPVS
ncbi:MAG: hypothetical protein CFH32_00299 [Alphaproteobacteria bacterium MarineAlpha9_Bin2]|nr:MAG: hypothetical protein CFH31_00208 [Alphaproteobacteria bacterium MarineAlpha9_Bin1]PPR31183.1 MAG: hypothetical protein CFH32_00299 [Alphaproteobacteria bacterium MarineAlpha9_Bin2]